MTYNERVMKLARKLALQYLNDHRAKGGLKPATRIAPLWWKMYHQEFIDKACAELALGSEEVAL